MTDSSGQHGFTARIRIANAVAVLGEGVFDVRFERCFVGLADHVSPLNPDLSSYGLSYKYVS